ncbi:MAG: radical SAM protein [Syntrophomonadaceae bacterium]|nr:radical SAM protein [Syntrophomonadaceae bacterium]MDD3890027.1 radical SAM protein [Syntrophomonadaceae bacterium]MDD4548145.1 radical SAM protein [Syntrophomonadaceae bacterium]
MKTFGPIPSRRLGNSLGINNIPPKICTYTCVYCQQGHSSKMQLERQAFYDPDELVQEVKEKVKQTGAAGEKIDFLTFVPDGEPTLDINLGKEIDLLKPLGIKIAVITNSSLTWRQDVRNELAKADLVSVSIDSIDENIWREVDHPLKQLSIKTILGGLVDFANTYTGELITETMMVKGINDGEESLEKTARFIKKLNPARAYLGIPTRPPADKWVEAPDEQSINKGFQIFKQHIDTVEYLIGYEGNNFASTGNIEEDILSITAVHPMREDAIRDLLTRVKEDWKIIDKLIKEEKLVKLTFDGNNFYMRKLYEGYKR